MYYSFTTEASVVTAHFECCSIGVGANLAGPVWPDHFFVDLIKFIIKNAACTKYKCMDHFKFPSYTPCSEQNCS